jgi:uncharacterized repeat protein (TIGR01451 family)
MIKLMNTNTLFAKRKVGLCALILTATYPACGQSDQLTVKSIAEVESTVTVQGRAVSKLVAADRVVPGDRVLYTLEVSNLNSMIIASPIVTHPVPEHMRYVADSAVGPGAEVSYSIDGGKSFDQAANLRVQGTDGQPRAAVATDYTHIRWALKNPLKVNSMAFLRFRAVVK